MSDPDAEDAGRMLRPEFEVLPDSALVPGPDVITPPPNRFTHRLTVDEPYFFGSTGAAGTAGARPDGVLPRGTPVVLLVDGGDRCRVVDPAGRYVEVRRTSLREVT